MTKNLLPPLKQMQKRVDAAWQIKMQWQPVMDDIYEFILPWRQSTTAKGGRGGVEGKPKMNRVFDGTAIKSAFRFPGRMQRDITPPFQDFLSLETGPMWPDGEDKKKVNEELERISRIMNAALQSGDFDTSSHEAYTEYQSGQFALLVEEGDDPEPVDVTCVPMDELAFELDAKGKRVTGVSRKRKYRIDQLEEMWPKGNFSGQIKDRIEAGSADEVEVIQYNFYDPKIKKYRLLVWINSSDAAGPKDAYIWHETARTNRWITPRFFVVPGETYGRGPAFIALPFVKTLNKAQELALRAAAFAVKPAWAAQNDSGINPDTTRLAPGRIIKMKRTGGPMGRSLERLPIPADFDISSFIIKDQREQVKEAMFDAAMPDPTGAVRSPTEIVNRIKALVEDLEGAYGRIIREFLTPLARRVIEILERKRLLKTNLKIDHLITRIRVKSPLANAQNAAKVKSLVDWLELQISLFGPQSLEVYAVIEEIVPEIGRLLGVEERFIRGVADQKAKREEQAKAQQQAAQNEAQAKAGAQVPQQPGIEEQMGAPLA